MNSTTDKAAWGLRGPARPHFVTPSLRAGIGTPRSSLLIGVDVPPGRYRIAKAEGAYFARIDEQGDVIDDDLADGSVIVTVEPGDWALQYSGTLERLGSIEVGDLTVVDVAAVAVSTDG